jgi:hypothetical protein
MTTNFDNERVFQRSIPYAPQPFRACVSEEGANGFYEVLRAHEFSDSVEAPEPVISLCRDLADLSKGDHPDPGRWVGAQEAKMTGTFSSVESLVEIRLYPAQGNKAQVNQNGSSSGAVPHVGTCHRCSCVEGEEIAVPFQEHRFRARLTSFAAQWNLQQRSG